jgi:23S rRNA (guanine745-N1)-methyltransferase
MPALLCSVRGCGGPLSREERALVCSRGHSFDVARSGYVNLLQPQDRRSKNPGDSAAAVEARRRLTDAGHDAWLVEPFLLGSLAAQRRIDAAGLDISVPAIELAAKRYPAIVWIVANADRRLPFADGSFDFAMSVTARRNGGELRRLLRPGGRALVVVPGQDDLAELREAVLGRADRKDRAAAAIAELSRHLEPVLHRTIRRTTRYTADEVRDLLAATYRGARDREKERARSVGAMDITVSRELLVFARR